MSRLALVALTLFAAVPALAAGSPAGETTIPRMSAFLEWVPDGAEALYVRADSGRWYHVRLQSACPRILNRSNVHFLASPTDRLDRYSIIRADGWRCQIAS